MRTGAAEGAGSAAVRVVEHAGARGDRLASGKAAGETRGSAPCPLARPSAALALHRLPRGGIPGEPKGAEPARVLNLGITPGPIVPAFRPRVPLSENVRRRRVDIKRHGHTLRRGR